MKPKAISKTLLEQLLTPYNQKRFWSKVKVGGPDECWPWIGAKRPEKEGFYGSFWTGESCATSHRVAWATHHKKPIPFGVLILHSCIGCPQCCNPSHLRPGTQLENMREKVDQGRIPIGEGHGNSVQTVKSVLKLRAAYQSGGISYVTAAKMFGISKATVAQVVTRKTWRHV